MNTIARYGLVAAVCALALLAGTAILEAQPPGYRKVCEGGVCRLVPIQQERSVLATPPKAQAQGSGPKIMEFELLEVCAECPSGFRASGKRVFVLVPAGSCLCGDACTCR